MTRFASLAAWSYLVWLMLTWTFTLEQLLFGAAVAAAAAAAMAPLGAVVRPWRLLWPRTLALLPWLALSSAARVAAADLRLARRIWAPSRPLASGMVVAPTTAVSDAELALVALTTSLIATSQIVDVDRERGQLQYHTVAVPDDRRQVTQPAETLATRLLGGADDRPAHRDGDR